ncbi:uncharacterized protein DNG_09554 [Cephalotrichum gorgonifer]|uniref:Ams2/SPT21 N-terminal domain-containing protein n=1 Tax=Cephalotrichum gorgonifer TaxID=2041049 RepID=A0AAE8N5X8_9PEZI|nr:uncharacterized protein DNG_09554 [Cephalotrichum gorgonifer]
MSSAGNEDLGLQVKPMGLKVHYTFDKDSQDRCLARHPQLINAQTFVLDESTTIGLVDIRLCLQAVSQCSPELLANFDSDYVVYAYDYSEPDTPLVGQGMLSWLLDPNRSESANQSLSMVTGRVTKNVLAIFGNGIKDTLEVKLKLVHNSKVQRTEQSSQLQSFSQQPQLQLETSQLNMALSSQSMDAGASSAEWSLFMQSMSGFDTPGQMGSQIGSPLPMDDMNNSTNRASPHLTLQSAPSAGTAKVQPTASQPTSRPSSRASRKRQPTGRPRGRPRKRPAPEGHTSGYEDGTDGDDNVGPARKRVATTMVSDRAVTAPFSGTPDSLRVAASTSGSLRSFRPLAIAGSDGPTPGSHLQDVPRAPTPVPNADKLGRPGHGASARRPSALGQELGILTPTNSFSDARPALSPCADDARSPSVVPTPAAFSEDSGGEIGSSPPVPRPSRFLNSSPPPSSPILPPMPQHDSGFMSGGMEDCTLFDEPRLEDDDGCQTDAPAALAQAPQQNSQPTLKKKDNKDKVPMQYFRLQEGKGGMQDLVQVVSPYSIKPVNEADGPKRTRGDRRGSQPGPRPTSMGAGHDAQRANSAIPNLAGGYHPSPQSAPSAQGQSQDPPSRRSTPVPTQSQAQTNSATPTPPVTAPTPVSRAASPAVHAAQPEPYTAELPSSSATVVLQEVAQARLLNRSQSMGPTALSSAPRESTSTSGAGDDTVAKTEPPETVPVQQPRASLLSRPASFHDLPPPFPLPAVPASDPVGPVGPPKQRHLPNATSFSEAPCPPSDVMGPPPTSPPPPKSNKNYVKKQSIKERLERAVMNGEQPPFCYNCGAIETPTWRKINTRDMDGPPEYYEYSEKPGQITAIEILSRDAESKPLSHRLIKKALGPLDDKSNWHERLLCNPCGIWLSKNNKHRPEERWIKDHERLGQERRKRGTGRNPTRRKKSTNNKEMRDSMPPLTSEPYLPTDGLMDNGTTPEAGTVTLDQLSSLLDRANSQDFNGNKEDATNQTTASGRSGFSNAGSTHTRGTGTANSPIALDQEEDLGSTRRLLFPSPRHKSGGRDALSPMSPNIVTSLAPDMHEQNKELAAELAATAENSFEMPADDELEALFRSPRPSTPPPREQHSSGSKGVAFRTPSRTAATPTHRPITRSIARSIRSVQSSPMSQFAMLQTTPTRTPRARLLVPESPSLRRSPRINNSATKNYRRALDGMPDSELEGGLAGLGPEVVDPAEMAAILDNCFNGWQNMTPTPRKGGGGWDESKRWEELGDHGEWDLDGLDMGPVE